MFLLDGSWCNFSIIIHTDRTLISNQTFNASSEITLLNKFYCFSSLQTCKKHLLNTGFQVGCLMHNTKLSYDGKRQWRDNVERPDHVKRIMLSVRIVSSAWIMSSTWIMSSARFVWQHKELKSLEFNVR